MSIFTLLTLDTLDTLSTVSYGEGSGSSVGVGNSISIYKTFGGGLFNLRDAYRNGHVNSNGRAI